MVVDVTKVHPTLLLKLNNFIFPAMKAFGYEMHICQGARTAQEQHELYRQGRDLPGRVVTNCDGITKPSPHQVKGDGYGHAVDCCFSGATVEEMFAETKPWAVFGAMAMYHGLKWGGNWAGKLVDRPHIELPLT